MISTSLLCVDLSHPEQQYSAVERQRAIVGFMECTGIHAPVGTSLVQLVYGAGCFMLMLFYDFFHSGLCT